MSLSTHVSNACHHMREATDDLMQPSLAYEFDSLLSCNSHRECGRRATNMAHFDIPESPDNRAVYELVNGTW